MLVTGKMFVFKEKCIIKNQSVALLKIHVSLILNRYVFIKYICSCENVRILLT